MSINWIWIVAGLVGVALVLTLLVGAGVLFWLLHRACSKRA